MIQHPIARFGNVQRLGQQIVDVQYLDTLAPHRACKDIVIFLGLLDPEHVVEQQCVTIGGRQPLVRQTRRADDHAPELAGFGMDAKRGHSITARLSAAMMRTVRISSSGATKRNQRS